MEILCNKKLWKRKRLFWLSDLMLMLQVNQLLHMVDDLVDIERAAPEDGEMDLDDENRTICLTRIVNVLEMAKEFGFNCTVQYTLRAQAKIAQECTWSELTSIAAGLRERIADEFAGVLLLWIEDSDYYYPLGAESEGRNSELFGPQVAEHFKEAAVDISEAGACYATGRYTAAVYHLMRVTEAGLSAIAKRVGYPDSRPMWEPVLKFIDKQLKTDYDKMNALFKGDIEFISGIASHMHDVNLAWRRRVSHIEKTYTKDEAKRIFDATKGVMQHIAIKLWEEEKVV